MEQNTNTENKLWFKRKRYGWGWTPASKEGWYVLGVYLLFFVLAEVIFMTQMAKSPTNTKIGIFAVFIAIITTKLIWICYKKGEKPKWTWGEDKVEK